jgi:hypothetical protein
LRGWKEIKIVCPAIPFQTTLGARRTIRDKLIDIFDHSKPIE